MFHMSNYVNNVSLTLSEVLKDIGVDEKTVLRRRRGLLLGESTARTVFQLQQRNADMYFFGSQSEGTTTPGLFSDSDRLFSLNNSNVIQDWSEWEPAKNNYMMIQDETVAPGYCRLQLLRHDVPLPYNCVLNEHYFRDRERILFKNTCIHAIARQGQVRHGPAHSQEGQPGWVDLDRVAGFPCKSWPKQARHWLDRQGIGHWPSDNMKRYCESSGCFVVGVGSKDSDYEELEWRISTSLAERCLMYNMNITQIRCYVLMKMILKTYFKPHFGDAISSFICKTVLFHCIANTNSNQWRENNLLICLTFCLFRLYNCVLNDNCPHFIVHENNLILNRISPDIKHQVICMLGNIVFSNGAALLCIDCDALGARLRAKFNGTYGLLQNVESFKNSIYGNLLRNTALSFHKILQDIFSVLPYGNSDIVKQRIENTCFKLVKIFNEREGFEKIACSLLLSRLCTSLGSVLASDNIYQHNSISAKAFSWILLGLNSDISCGKLKLASMLYCVRDIQRTENILGNIDQHYDLDVVEPICDCHRFIHLPSKAAFNMICVNHNEEAIRHTIAFCVSFLPCEINCVPHELRYEMFRSTVEDRAFRGKDNHWMDWAAVDSLPYLYFLQYKTFETHAVKQRALSKLAKTIDNEPNLGHRETALNLLGQCMEQENRVVDAFRCYHFSLRLRERNNAAKLHICRLLNNILKDN